MKELTYFRERELHGRSTFNKNSLIKRMGLLNSDHHTDFSPDNSAISPVYCCRYCLKANNEHILALANEEGFLSLRDTNAFHPSPLTVKQVHKNAVFDVAWMEKESKLVTASGDQSVVLWDVSNSDISKISTFVGHTASVKTAAFRPNQNDIFATGARDGKIIIWDIRLSHDFITNKPDNYIEDAHLVTCGVDGLTSSRRKKTANVPPNSIISMVFQDENTLITCGAVDGVIKAWDLRKNYSVYKRVPLPKLRLPEKGPGSPNGFTSLILDPSRTRLFANCLDNSIYCFNASTFDSKPVSIYRGHRNYSFYVKCCMSPDGMYLLSGSSDGKAFIWNTSTHQQLPIVVLEGHSGEVTSVAWCKTAEPEFVTCSDDMTYGIWRVMSETSMDNLRCKVIWATESASEEKTFSVEPKDDPWKVSNAGEKDGIFEQCVSPCTPRTIEKWVQIQEQTPGTSDNERPATYPHTPRSSGTASRSKSEKIRKGSKRRLEEFLSSNESVENGVCQSERKILVSNGEVGGKGCTTLLPLTPRDRLRMPSSSVSPSSSLTVPSPTEGLPNYVLDGISPHRHSCSTMSKLKENVDWLTKLSKERKGKVNERYERFEESGSPTEVVPKRKHRRQVSFDRQAKVYSSGNLLKFFQSPICDNVPE